MTNRIYQIDLVRVVCIIWIVGVWHFYGNYPKEWKFEGFSFLIAGEITEIILATFTFLSGYFLAKYRFSSKADVLNFYKRRFIRFYILFAVAVIGMFFLLSVGGGVTSHGIVQMLSALVGLSPFFPPQITTLWYLSMLLLFYILTPLYKYDYKSHYVSLVWIVLFYVIFVTIYLLVGIDDKLLLYYPFYAIGLFIDKKQFELIIHPKWLIVLLGGAIFICYLMIGNQTYYLKYSYLIFGVPALISLCYLIYIPKFQKIITAASYSTLCVYLYHRFMYPLVIMLFSKTVDGYKFMDLPFVIISVVIFFVLGYFIQRVYDMMTNKLLFRYIYV